MKLFIITGASRGIGKAVALEGDRLFKGEARFVLMARNGKNLQTVSESLDNPSDTLTVDFSDPITLEQHADTLFESLNPADFSSVILINNAGVIEPIATADKTSASDLLKAFNINIISAMTLTSRFLAWSEHFKAERLVLNVSSGAASFTIPAWSAYCSTKAAMDMFTKVMMDEKHNTLKAFTIAPGIIETDMQSVVRGKTADEFPLVDDFINYQKDGQLKTPEQSAQEILGIVQNPEKFETMVKF